MSNKPILEVKNLSKIYPGVIALNKVNLEIIKGEVHALVGENGAGKSTLIKCITGAEIPTEGSIIFEGKEYSHINPNLAIQYGISAIYQEFNLVNYQTVAENIMIGRYPNKFSLINDKKMREESEKVMEELGVPIDVNTKVGTLTVGYQQLVEIAKAVSRNAKLIIMDEPSAALTNNEIKYLFQIIDQLKEKGISILYISHRLEEIFEICDRVTVLRDGNYITTRNIKDTTKDELIKLMVNRELSNTYPHNPLKKGRKSLSVRNLNTGLLKNISFDAYENEILGFSGLVGSGRTEIMRAIFGADKIDSGEIYLYDKKYIPVSPKKAIENRIGYISEDRKKDGLCLHLDIKENTVMADYSKVAKMGVLNEKEIMEATKRECSKMRVKTPSYYQLAKNLSGGNQQKVVLAKWLFADCDIIIFDEPTRGIDVGTKQEIYQLMHELVESGKTIIMVSSEMPEMLGMADRIIVMHEGKMMAELTRDQANQELLMKYASNAA
jgi:ribose transport system ATP-binding protein